MGGRYLITGTELALLGQVSEQQCKEIAKKIEEERFIFVSANTIDEDVKYVRKKVEVDYG